jgi:hypothetical protein
MFFNIRFCPHMSLDSRHRGQMVRGEASRYARVQQGLIELPPDFSAGYSGIFSLQEPGSR